MIRLLQFVLFGHVHKWKTIATSPLYRPEEIDLAPKNLKAGTRYTQQCEHCGKVIKRDLM